MTQLLLKDVKFDFSDDCKNAFNLLKEKLTTASIIISPDWNVPFELMCDASDFVVRAVLGQRIDGKFNPIYYASKTLNNAQEHYATTEKELLAVVFSFDKFRPYLILSKTIVYTDHSVLKYLFSIQDAKPRLIRLENPDLGVFTEEEITDEFLDEHLMMLKAKPNDDEPWLCLDNIIRRCIVGGEILEILAHCHSGPIRGYHSASITRRKRSGNISSRSKIPQNNIQVPRIGLKSSTMHYRNLEPPTKHPWYVHPLDWFMEKIVTYLWRSHKAYWALKQCNMDLAVAGKNCFIELNELMELRDGAYKNTRIYKERTKKWHDSGLRGDKDFKVRDKALLFNSRLRMHLEITDKNGISFKVNGQRLKKYYDGHIDTEDKDVVEFNEDTT
ncbi:reverse transcriptase domain-containing protein [Tanacetum coccineum]